VKQPLESVWFFMCEAVVDFRVPLCMACGQATQRLESWWHRWFGWRFSWERVALRVFAIGEKTAEPSLVVGASDTRWAGFWV